MDTDRHLGRLLDAVQGSDLLVVATSDHGESRHGFCADLMKAGTAR